MGATNFDLRFFCIIARAIFGVILLFALDAWIREGGPRRLGDLLRRVWHHADFRRRHPDWRQILWRR